MMTPVKVEYFWLNMPFAGFRASKYALLTDANGKFQPKLFIIETKKFFVIFQMVNTAVPMVPSVT